MAKIKYAKSTTAKSAAKVLRNKSASKAAKAVAASALSQIEDSRKTTSYKIALAAGKILKSKTASKAEKTAAASALTQKSSLGGRSADDDRIYRAVTSILTRSKKR